MAESRFAIIVPEKVVTLSRLEQIALSDKSLVTRWWAYIVWQQEEHVRTELAHSLVGAVLIGVIALLYRWQIDFGALIWALLGFAALFVGKVIVSASRAPSEVDKALKEYALRLARESENALRYKLFLEVDTKPRMTTHWEWSHSGVFIADDEYLFNPPGIKPVQVSRFLFTADIRVRFDNRDTVTSRVELIQVTLNYQTESIVLPLEITNSDGRRISIDDSGLPVDAGVVTQYYRLGCEKDLELSWREKFGDDCFLRVEMKAIRQANYHIDLDVDWPTAIGKNEKAYVAIRDADKRNASS